MKMRNNQTQRENILSYDINTMINDYCSCNVNYPDNLFLDVDTNFIQNNSKLMILKTHSIIKACGLNNKNND